MIAVTPRPVSRPPSLLPVSLLLTYMGAMMQAMEIMNVKIYKEVRNNVNRSVNCEAANLDKTIAAAQKQADDINYIFEKRGEGYLPDELLQVAKIRLTAHTPIPD